jgi:site-specific recombinase XerD
VASVERVALTERQLGYVRFRAIRSPEYASTVRLTLLSWQRFLGGRQDVEATRQDAQAYIASRSGRWSDSTCYRVAGCLRSYHTWIGTEPNPWDGVRLPAPQRSIPRVVAPEEWSRLEAVLSDLPTEARARRRGLRRWAALRLLFAGGLRNCELRRLRYEDLDLERRYAIVKGKGRKERTVPFGTRTQSVLSCWLSEGRPWYIRGQRGPLFPSERGAPLTASAVDGMMRTALRAAGIDRRLYPHLLRHTYATTLLEGGANIREVQELLGHASLHTTEIYTHCRPERLREAYDHAYAGLG